MPAILYVPEAFTTATPKLMGRNSAGESFLRAYVKYAREPEFNIFVGNKNDAKPFAEILKANQRNEPVNVITMASLGRLNKAGTLFMSGPGLGTYAWQRNFFGSSAWSLCGLTHTTSSARIMEALTDFITAPIQPWDALICTSNAVKKNVTNVLQAQVDYLQERLGLSKLVLPKLPVIPLGIHTQDFSFSAETKALARKELGLEDNTRVVLFVGRLSFHAKAHPIPMYQALEEACKLTKEKIVLIECGWHANESIAQAFESAAKQFMPSIKVLLVNGIDKKKRQTAWAAADIFCSLADNFQESFGLTPIEAMAAGLPVVVSDWNGYKESVRHEIDGFRVKTTMPVAHLGEHLALRYALEIDNYDFYSGLTSNFVAVDVADTCRALVALISSKELCQKMGASGKTRARQVYDWSQIIPQYGQLWQALDNLRKHHEPKASIWPAHLSPYRTYTAYPSQTLQANFQLALVDNDLEASQASLAKIYNHQMVHALSIALPSFQELNLILEAVGQNTPTVAEILRNFPEARQNFIWLSLTWFLKFNLLKIV